mmetsp:Transcript_21861/g.64374  ORF Transcript_21861/g.64374 Transcript_21861/m.64374 type:complete len:200 (+) Transcript_21861:45-644(+)
MLNGQCRRRLLQRRAKESKQTRFGSRRGGRPPHADRRRCACSAISEMRRGATGKRARAGLRPAGGSRYRAPSRAALPFGGGIPGVGRPAALCVAACLALPALEALLALVSIFLKKGAFFRMSGRTMKRTCEPRRKTLESISTCPSFIVFVQLERWTFMLSSASSSFPLYTSPFLSSTVTVCPSASCSTLMGMPMFDMLF